MKKVAEFDFWGLPLKQKGTLIFALICTLVTLCTIVNWIHLQLPRGTPFYHRSFLSTASNVTISAYLRTLTRQPHLAGTPPSLSTANFVLSQFQSFGLETSTARFQALLSYPLHSSLSLHFRNGTAVGLPLAEPGSSAVVPPYHAYSPSGSVTSTAVFANYGREEDYEALIKLGVDVAGSVVVVRKGDDLSRGAVVRVAQRVGAAAVLIYAEDDRTVKSGVERGTVIEGVGDPQSPGWAVDADNGGEILGLDDPEVSGRFPRIPSLPLSLECAEKILGEIGGPPLPAEWRESLRSRIPGVGPGPAVLKLTYQGEKKIATIQNVFAIIRGSKEPDRYVLLGNHRDAWAYGAVDPNSGTAALLDIARRYSLIMRMGWKPRRTIILCSWDAEEFGMMGSTEWVERNIVNVGSKSVAYLNVDCAVQGPGLFARSTPQLDDLLVEITKKVKDPDTTGATVYKTWTEANKGINIERLSGVDSDYSPFLQYAGIPSVDIYYGRDFPVYHTAYDTYDWMAKNGDPTFQRHVSASGIWGLLALHLADDPIIPFNYVSYAIQLQGYVDVLSKLLSGSISLHPLSSSIQALHSAAKEVQAKAAELRSPVSIEEDAVLMRRAVNDQLMLAERGFLDADGLQGRKWFKHLIYGPHGDYGSKLRFFPSIADAMKLVESRDIKESEGNAVIQHEIWRVSRAIQRAADALRGI
ncbi:hypothetical protein SAY87_018697 [Trapa incisa]|uniref:glutamate carboxypeptidase II n=1 Tax=Trapa incisa TaxID=236973 RepID=A0AAN7Q0Q4_9MYRT|nr:hypothetical protein SAY87_018697 [Trapa incisa]